MSAQEIADRTAIEEAWLRFWTVYVKITSKPAPSRPAIIDTVAVDPVRASILAAAAKFDNQGLGLYGEVGHRIYWGPPVDGETPAIMGDCMNQEGFGSVDLKTGVKKTKGLERANYRGTFQRQGDGSWKVSVVDIYANIPC